MKKLTLIAVSILLFNALHAQQTILKAKRLIDGTGKVIEHPIIVIEDKHIVSILTEMPSTKGATIIELGDYTLLPGLIDAHAHPNNNSDDYQIAHLKGSSASKALTSLKAVQDLLNEGWTALRVAGDADVAYSNFDVRNSINKGKFIGPHIYGAGHYLSVIGGGGDINFLSPEQNITADGLIVNGPEEVRKAVRTEIKYGSDWIKIMETGAFMTIGDNPQNVHFSPEELKAAIEEANRRDVPVMAHAHATEGIKQAVKAGVRSIEHGTYMDDEAIDLMIQHGTYLIPTLTIDLYFKEIIPESKSLTKAIDLGKQSRAAFYVQLKKAIKNAKSKGVRYFLEKIVSFVTAEVLSCSISLFIASKSANCPIEAKTFFASSYLDLDNNHLGLFGMVKIKRV